MPQTLASFWRESQLLAEIIASFFSPHFLWLACQPESSVWRTLWISQHFAYDVQALWKSIRQQEIGTQSSGSGNDKKPGERAGEKWKGEGESDRKVSARQWRPQPDSLVYDGFDPRPGWLEKRLMPLQPRAAEGRPRCPPSLTRRHSGYDCKTHLQTSHFCVRCFCRVGLLQLLLILVWAGTTVLASATKKVAGL